MHALSQNVALALLSATLLACVCPSIAKHSPQAPSSSDVCPDWFSGDDSKALAAILGIDIGPSGHTVGFSRIFNGCPASHSERASRLLERFIRYAQVQTTSSKKAYPKKNPTTPGQAVLAKIVRDDIVALDPRGNAVTADLGDDGLLIVDVEDPRAEEQIHVRERVGFYAHLDASEDFTGRNVRPQIWRNYRGDALTLPKRNVTVDPAELPFLEDRIGDTVVTSSGDTLLGADDKAGVTAIVTMVESMLCPSLDGDPGKPLFAPFTLIIAPDGEVTVPFRRFEDMEVDMVYALDDEIPGDVRYETMTTDFVVLTFEGFEMHTSFAKGTTGHGRLYNRKLRSAITAASMFVADMYNTGRTAEQTQQREPFFHVVKARGTVARAVVCFWVRSFDDEGLQGLWDEARSLIAGVQQRFPGVSIRTKIDHISVWRPRCPLRFGIGNFFARPWHLSCLLVPGSTVILGV